MQAPPPMLRWSGHKNSPRCFARKETCTPGNRRDAFPSKGPLRSLLSGLSPDKIHLETLFLPMTRLDAWDDHPLKFYLVVQGQCFKILNLFIDLL